MSSLILFVHAISPLHAGTGQSIGAIDLPTARERSTGLPYVPGSSLKGSLRDAFKGRAEQTALFGPETRNGSEHAGALAFGDANILLFPARSVAGTWAWLTSPYLLERLTRDLVAEPVGGRPEPPQVPDIAELREAAVTPACALRVPVKGQQKVVLEDLDLDPREEPDVQSWAVWLGDGLFPSLPGAPWRKHLERKICVVHDDVLIFLSEHGTDVVARVALENEKKTVRDFWYEESLPTETVLVSLVTALPNGKIEPAVALEVFREHVASKPSIQLGGKATVGRGQCRLVAA